MSDVGLLLLRVVPGGLLAGHGAQKLFGWFGGEGPRGTARFLESIGIRSAERLALAAGATELAAGTLTALGLLWPLGPIAVTGPMAMALGKVHRGRPIRVTQGGGELPLTNLAIAGALALTGPGRLSVDRQLGLRVPRALVVLTVAGVAAGLGLALRGGRPRPAEHPVGAGIPQPIGTPEMGAMPEMDGR